mmetsp:Transcript_43281/g.106864  ORF Transcript_43281/g.106864 Transcript_43281/m.106864 type:complete len:324 (+) Transcript_43281:4746-5717(+)
MRELDVAGGKREQANGHGHRQHFRGQDATESFKRLGTQLHRAVTRGYRNRSTVLPVEILRVLSGPCQQCGHNAPPPPPQLPRALRYVHQLRRLPGIFALGVGLGGGAAGPTPSSGRCLPRGACALAGRASEALVILVIELEVLRPRSGECHTPLRVHTANRTVAPVRNAECAIPGKRGAGSCTRRGDVQFARKQQLGNLLRSAGEGHQLRERHLQLSNQNRPVGDGVCSTSLGRSERIHQGGQLQHSSCTGPCCRLHREAHCSLPCCLRGGPRRLHRARTEQVGEGEPHAPDGIGRHAVVRVPLLLVEGGGERSVQIQFALLF